VTCSSRRPPSPTCAAEIDAARCWSIAPPGPRIAGAPRVTREASDGQDVATEAAQRVIDRAVQIHGGLGVTKGVKVEELYREIRALRIYEGATEVQKVVIARDLLNMPRSAERRERHGDSGFPASGHQDFARDNLPPRESWPDLP
jgi:acyl-CoA dehydrogenase